MERAIFDREHDEFRASFRSFIAKELTPHYLEWEDAGIAPRDLFAAAGQNGFVGMSIPEDHGGGGVRDFRFNAVLAEELAAAGIGGAGLGITLHNDITTPYFVEYCNPEQARRWLPGIASGDLITAIAMTEPGTGSDLAGIASTAVRDGETYIVNGSKTFITNGINADLIIVAVRTDASSRHGGLTLLVIERGMEGFERGRNLDKIGMHSQDTAELFFTDVRVSAANRLGDEGRGFQYLTANLAQERLSIAVTGVASARAALDWTVAYVKERKAFGQPISAFQNTKFVLAEVKTEISRPGIRRPGRDRTQRRHPVARRRCHRQVVVHRATETRHRSLPAAVRRLRLHARVPDRPGLHRRPHHHDLRRHHRSDEGHHRPRPRALTTRSTGWWS